MLGLSGVDVTAPPPPPSESMRYLALMAALEIGSMARDEEPSTEHVKKLQARLAAQLPAGRQRRAPGERRLQMFPAPLSVEAVEGAVAQYSGQVAPKTFEALAQQFQSFAEALTRCVNGDLRDRNQLTQLGEACKALSKQLAIQEDKEFYAVLEQRRRFP